jgi:hypothetical protein
MKKLTDQELDSIFKDAAESHQPAYDPAAWEAMANRLDQPVKKMGWNKWITYLLLGSVIFLVGIWVGTNLTDNSNEQSQSKSEATRKGAGTNQELSVESKVEREKFVVPIFENENSKVGINKLGIRVQHDGTDSLDRPQRIITDEVQPAKILNTLEPVFVISDNVESLNNETIHVPDKEVSHQEMDSVWVKEGVQKEQEPDSVLSADSIQVKREVKDVKPIFIRALVSPDISSLDFAPTDLIGTNYSLLLEYQFKNHLSISTGAILSTKVYSSPDEIIYGQYKANAVDGTCKILDIPVNANFYFLNTRKISLFTGLGVSSYFMLSEDYTFYVNTTSGTRAFDWSFQRENIDWFSVLNISMGIQYKLGNRYYAQVEPFVKAPIAGVGEWDLNLSSWGVFIGMKYRLTK